MPVLEKKSEQTAADICAERDRGDSRYFINLGFRLGISSVSGFCKGSIKLYDPAQLSFVIPGHDQLSFMIPLNFCDPKRSIKFCDPRFVKLN